MRNLGSVRAQQSTIGDLIADAIEPPCTWRLQRRIILDESTANAPPQTMTTDSLADPLHAQQQDEGHDNRTTVVQIPNLPAAVVLPQTSDKHSKSVLDAREHFLGQIGFGGNSDVSAATFDEQMAGIRTLARRRLNGSAFFGIAAAAAPIAAALRSTTGTSNQPCGAEAITSAVIVAVSFMVFPCVPSLVTYRAAVLNLPRLIVQFLILSVRISLALASVIENVDSQAAGACKIGALGFSVSSWANCVSVSVPIAFLTAGMAAWAWRLRTVEVERTIPLRFGLPVILPSVSSGFPIPLSRWQCPSAAVRILYVVLLAGFRGFDFVALALLLFESAIIVPRTFVYQHRYEWANVAFSAVFHYARLERGQMAHLGQQLPVEIQPTALGAIPGVKNASEITRYATTTVDRGASELPQATLALMQDPNAPTYDDLLAHVIEALLSEPPANLNAHPVEEQSIQHAEFLSFSLGASHFRRLLKRRTSDDSADESFGCFCFTVPRISPARLNSEFTAFLQCHFAKIERARVEQRTPTS